MLVNITETDGKKVTRSPLLLERSYDASDNVCEFEDVAA